jgi:hypothetical protein
VNTLTNISLKSLLTWFMTILTNLSTSTQLLQFLNLWKQVLWLHTVQRRLLDHTSFQFLQLRRHTHFITPCINSAIYILNSQTRNFKALNYKCMDVHPNPISLSLDKMPLSIHTTRQHYQDIFLNMSDYYPVCSK